MAYIRTLRNACSKHPFNTLQQVLWQILNQRIKALETEIKKKDFALNILRKSN